MRLAALTCAFLVACGGDKDAKDKPEDEPEAPGGQVSAAPQAPLPATPGDAPTPALPGKSADAGDGVHVWSTSIGGEGADAARAVAVDSKGHTVVTGYFSDAAQLGGDDPVAAEGKRDIFLAKYDSNGKWLWAKRFGGDGDDIGQSVAIDKDDNIVVTGTFTDKATVGGATFESAGETDLFIAKYDKDGTHLWSHSVGGRVEDRGYAVAAGPDGSIAMTGYFTDKVNFGGEDLVSGGQADLFVVLYGPDGDHKWSYGFGDKLDELGRGVAIDKDGNVIVAGDYNKEITIGATHLVSSGNADVLLTKFTKDGAAVWAKSFGSVFNDFAVAVAVDANGQLAVTGSFEQTVNFGGEDLKGPGKKDIFVARYTAAGQHLWSKKFGSTDDDVGSGIAMDTYGNVFVAGWYWFDIDLGGGKLKSTGENDIFVAKFAPDGSHVWSHSFGGEGADFGRALAVDNVGRVTVAGTFRTPIDFGGGPVAFRGPAVRPPGDAFIARFSR